MCVCAYFFVCEGGVEGQRAEMRFIERECPRERELDRMCVCVEGGL